jgi:ABC-type glycerol-3-phosphate transport system substrate-binding protein
MKTTFRLSVLVLLFVLGLSPGALRGGGPAVAGTSGRLTVLDWPGFDDKKFWMDFNKKYPDVTVDFNLKENDAAIYTAIKMGDQADIIHPYTTWLKRWVDEGLVEEIDVTKLANWDKIPESLKAIGRFDGPRPLVSTQRDRQAAVQIQTFGGVILKGFQEGNHDAQPDRSHHSLPHLNSGLRLRVSHRL